MKSVFKHLWRAAGIPIKQLIVFLAQRFRIDLVMLGYHNSGILNYQNLDISGELYVIRHLYKRLLPEQATIFDVGANVGDYTIRLRKELPTARVYAFEPNYKAFQVLRQNFAGDSLVVGCNVALGDETGPAQIALPVDSPLSSHASLSQDVLRLRHQQIVVSDCDLMTIDEFCVANNIAHIHLLKIDTEGYEFKILSGARQMILADRISLIQFEFNDMNIITRVFLRDFFDLLDGFVFYRLGTARLIPLNPYHPRHEIFLFQNILAVNTSLIDAPITDQARKLRAWVQKDLKQGVS